MSCEGKYGPVALTTSLNSDLGGWQPVYITITGICKWSTGPFPSFLLPECPSCSSLDLTCVLLWEVGGVFGVRVERLVRLTALVTGAHAGRMAWHKICVRTKIINLGLFIGTLQFVHIFNRYERSLHSLPRRHGFHVLCMQHIQTFSQIGLFGNSELSKSVSVRPSTMVLSCPVQATGFL